MPAGIPVATFAIGKAGAKNAALFALSLLGLESGNISKKLKNFRSKQTNAVRKMKVKV
jgi:5-(carboxyamino)imidazole ribonucleotide mutase